MTFIGRGLWGVVLNGCHGHSIEGGMIFSLGVRYNGTLWLHIFPLGIFLGGTRIPHRSKARFDPDGYCLDCGWHAVERKHDRCQ